MTTFRDARRLGPRPGPRRRLHWNDTSRPFQHMEIPCELRETRPDPQRRVPHGLDTRREDQWDHLPRSWTNKRFRGQNRQENYILRGTNIKYPSRDGRRLVREQPRRDTLDTRKLQQKGNTQGKEDSNTSPEYQKFSTTVRKIYNIIRSFHHLSKISTKTSSDKDPPTIANMVHCLSNTLKPARLTETTQLLLEGNAKNWAYTTRLILEEHYLSDIEQNTQALQDLVDESWQLPFKIAEKWAFRHFRKRLDKEALEKTEALLVTLASGSGEVAQVIIDPPPQNLVCEQPLLSEQEFPPLARANVATSPTIPRALSPFPIVHQRTLALPQRTIKTKTNRVTGQANPALATISQNPELNEITPTPEPQKERTIPRQRLIEESFLASERNILIHAPVSQGPQVVESAQEDQNIGESPIEKEAPTEEPLISFLDEDDDEMELSHLPSPLIESSPERRPAQIFRPVRHINTTKKMTEWSLTVKKKWLWIGDSNLARIPDHQFEGLQIDSFPGSTFRHAEAILARAHITTEVEKVVLSFGINHKAQKAKETAIKQLQRAVKKAQECFPRAGIWVPVVNFSKALKWEEQEVLEKLNRHIKKNMTFIEPLPDSDFFVVEDKIHWRPPTAKSMLIHWVKALNLIAL